MRLRIACSAALAVGLAVAAALAVTGCVKANEGPEVPLMCSDELACPGGETCHEGICVGPVSLRFGALLVPPEGRTDLVMTELPDVHTHIDEHGRLTDASFGPSVRVRGRIVLNSAMEASVAAGLTFRRPSEIEGGPDYVVTASAIGGVEANDTTPAFEVLLPENNGVPWEVTVRPDDGRGYHPTPDYQPPDRLAAPLRLSWVLDSDLDVVVPLVLSEGLKNVRGRVVDAAGRGIEGMQVTLWGRQALSQPLEVASSIGTTLADGSFSIFARSDGENTYDVEMTAGDDVKVDGLPLAGAPTLRRSGIVVEDPGAGFSVTFTLDDITYPPFGVPATYTIPVYGRDSAGTQLAADGAKLVATTVLDGASAGDVVTYTADATIGADGLAVVDLIPGTDQNRVYTIQVIPAPSAQIGAVWDLPIEVGAYPGTLAELSLPPRTFVTGRILDEFGKPAASVQVSPKLSLSFLLGLSQADQDRLDKMTWADAVTDLDGRYSLYLDATVMGLPATFDLELTPPLSSLQPRWSQDRVSIPEGMNAAFDVGDYALPPVSFAWALVTDAEGFPIAGADLKVYVLADPTLCAGAADCAPPARLVDVARSDENGELTMSLPKPLSSP